MATERKASIPTIRAADTAAPRNIDGTTDMRTKEGRKLYGVAEKRDEAEGTPGSGGLGKNDPDAINIPKNKDGTVDRRTREGRLYEALHREEATR